jgi:hypothetical protein
MPEITDAGTTAEGTEAPSTTGTPAAPDEVTTLRSRNQGLDAKVSELLKSAAAEKARADAAEARALELAQGKDNGDQELRAQLAAKDQQIAQAQKAALLARVESKYPETFGVFGDAAAGMSEDQLAASEARMAGVAVVGETSKPNPLGANPARPAAPATKSLEDMSVAELKAQLGTFNLTQALTRSTD